MEEGKNMNMSVCTESLKVASGSGYFFEELRETLARMERTSTINYQK